MGIWDEWATLADCIQFYSYSKLFVLHYQATTDETKYNDDDDENYHYKLNLNIYIAVNMYIALLWQPLYV